MNVNLNTTFENGRIKVPNNAQSISNKSNTIDGKTLNLGDNKLDEKKSQVKKDAMKLIRDAFEGDQKISDAFNEKKRHVEELIKRKGEADKIVNDIENNRKSLRDEYGLSENSQEEKELKLLEKEFIVQSYSNTLEIQEENRSLGMMEREMLKNTSMIDAKKQAKKLEEEADKTSSNVVEAQHEVNEKVSKANMLEEDIKGIEVDDKR